ncbi:unnamed protein product [Rotaria sordida]|uniref:F-box domain-containing protein n=1 Tax=Rotaria sordida TaxID=392033 RepID=A0A815C3I3_9BILA|nr:unnamed protein product [Rotaria sordida]
MIFISEQISASILSLPTELVYLILDNLDDFTILCSIRNVCTRLNQIIDTYPRYQTLTILKFRSKHIGALEAQHLANAIRNNYVLTTLDVNYDSIEDNGTDHIADVLRNNTTLTTLKLHSFYTAALQIQHLADTLRNNTTLTTLTLSNNDINEHGAKQLSDALRNNTTLTTLDLSFNLLERRGTFYLANAL